MKTCLAIPAALAASLCAPSAFAASSDWHHAEGASLRMVVSDLPDADGRLRGALEIRLKPGWKTYWADPGDAGVPPSLELAEGSIDVAFPAPQRFDDGYAVWTGYDRPVALALTLDPGGKDGIDARAFLGLCETICIPVQARFSVGTTASASRPEDEVIVAEAFAALPGPARPGFEARLVQASADTISIEIEAPQGAAIVDLFVAAEGGLTLDTPERTGPTGFSLPVLRGGDALPEGIAYTLVTSAGAVSGTLRLRPAQ